LPDVNLGEFTDKTFLPYTPMGSPDSFSRHATSVGRLLYGDENSMAPGITEIHNYAATFWLTSVLHAGQPRLPRLPSCRIANHSWIAETRSPAMNGDILRRTDWLSEHDSLLQVVGIGNQNKNEPLLGSAYNVISVGRTDGQHGMGTAAVDPIYNAGRAQPLIVAPMNTVSAAVPVVAAAAAVLIDEARTIGAPDDNDVIKAALMAGADRSTDNGVSANIDDYRGKAEFRTGNGLDRRYGAGQINIANSYAIISAWRHGAAGSNTGQVRPIGAEGFDNVRHFGGARGTPRELDYAFDVTGRHPQLAVALVWQLDVRPDAIGPGWKVRLSNLDLHLYDETSQQYVAWSDSTAQNTENIYTNLIDGHRYRLRVSTVPREPDFDGGYALAWRIFDSDRRHETHWLWTLPLLVVVMLGAGLLSRTKS
jgi:hypothetical protein